MQVIKKDKQKGGILQFGTEVVTCADGSIAALLGASPGASTSVSIMLNVLERCFKNEMNSAAWQQKLKEMIPTYGISSLQHPELYLKAREESAAVLGLK